MSVRRTAARFSWKDVLDGFTVNIDATARRATLVPR